MAIGIKGGRLIQDALEWGLRVLDNCGNDLGVLEGKGKN